MKDKIVFFSGLTIGTDVQFMYHDKPRKGKIEAINNGANTMTIKLDQPEKGRPYKQFRYADIANLVVWTGETVDA